MSTFEGQTPQGAAQVVLKDEPLGRGGEGAVFEVVSHSLGGLPPAKELVGKVYHAFESSRGKKLVAMVVQPPEASSVAWPLALLVKDGRVMGYLMEKLPAQDYRMWAELAHSQQRKASAGSFDVRYALTAALNFAYALSAVHEAGHRVGDINESNVFIGRDASVLLVDTDSAQIAGKGVTFPCMVGKAEYTAAELTHGALKDQERTEASDVFGFTVATYQLLLGGPHPTDGIFAGEGDPPAVVERIRQGIYPNLKKDRSLKPVPRVASSGIPSRLRPLLLEALSPSPEARPSLGTLEEALEDILDNLKQCSKVKQHWFDARDKRCGWCAHAKEGNPDPWNLKPPKAKSSQKKLPPISFKDGASGTSTKKAPRAPRAPARGAPAGPSPAPGRGSRGVSPAGGPRGTLVPVSSVYQPTTPPLPLRKGKSVLAYQDGTSGIRPPLAQVWQSSPRLAWRCFVNELPEPLLLGWRFKQGLPQVPGLLLGLLLAALVAGGTYLFLPGFLTANLPPFAYKAMSIELFTLVATGTALGGPLLKVLMTFRELRAVQRVVGSVEQVEKEALPVTLGKVGGSSLLYGAPLIFFLLVAALLGLISGLLTIVRNENRRY